MGRAKDAAHCLKILECRPCGPMLLSTLSCLKTAFDWRTRKGRKPDIKVEQQSGSALYSLRAGLGKRALAAKVFENSLALDSASRSHSPSRPRRGGIEQTGSARPRRHWDNLHHFLGFAQHCFKCSLRSRTCFSYSSCRPVEHSDCCCKKELVPKAACFAATSWRHRSFNQGWLDL